MTNKLVVIINSLVLKIKKILLYEMKFLVPNYSCLQNPWLGGYHPQISVLSVLNWICWNPTTNKIPGYATDQIMGQIHVPDIAAIIKPFSNLYLNISGKAAGGVMKCSPSHLYEKSYGHACFVVRRAYHCMRKVTNTRGSLCDRPTRHPSSSSASLPRKGFFIQKATRKDYNTISLNIKPWKHKWK